MPFILIGIGVLLVVLAVKGTQRKFLALLVGDFTGKGNFIYWVISILVVGALGYIPRLKVLSDSFLFLILLVLFISNRGFFNQFNSQVSSGTSATPTGSNSGITVTPLAPLQGFAVAPGYNLGATP